MEVGGKLPGGVNPVLNPPEPPSGIQQMDEMEEDQTVPSSLEASPLAGQADATGGPSNEGEKAATDNLAKELLFGRFVGRNDVEGLELGNLLQVPKEADSFVALRWGFLEVHETLRAEGWKSHIGCERQWELFVEVQSPSGGGKVAGRLSIINFNFVPLSCAPLLNYILLHHADPPPTDGSIQVEMPGLLADIPTDVFVCRALTAGAGSVGNVAAKLHQQLHSMTTESRLKKSYLRDQSVLVYLPVSKMMVQEKSLAAANLVELWRQKREDVNFADDGLVDLFVSKALRYCGIESVLLLSAMVQDRFADSKLLADFGKNDNVETVLATKGGSHDDAKVPEGLVARTGNPILWKSLENIVQHYDARWLNYDHMLDEFPDFHVRKEPLNSAWLSLTGQQRPSMRPRAVLLNEDSSLRKKVEVYWTSKASGSAEHLFSTLEAFNRLQIAIALGTDFEMFSDVPVGQPGFKPAVPFGVSPQRQPKAKVKRAPRGRGAGGRGTSNQQDL
jgi:hypothetical protein